MQWPWGNGWTLFWLTVLLLVLLIACVTVIIKKRKRKEYLVTVEGTVMKVLADDTDRRGGMHQRLLIKITKVLDNPEDADVDTQHNVLVTMRFGDRDGFPERLGVFDKADGKRIEIRGKYIPAENNMGNRKQAVIHFTHKPIGYVRLNNKTYR
ncbi:hypothetical protein [Effusibacillus lacus]|uniref:Uncharacterized protein n=1 Tax=Effusibacillus lacus TaxID=1348429 RepID=A0A292YJT8_9BACL|nr:hypothetical protein [Effusibacillus lacus]TCS72339.1 hypothetical protein EDD64_12292 [Effusibacillus lacus]GAX90198.1 hypothetical protein EFBL_1824 [Effusibacillus lacus]